MKKKYLYILATLPLLMGNDGCTPEKTTDQKVAEQQAASLTEAQAQVGMPSIINFQEKRMLKTVYELRDSAVSTHTYIVNQMTGCLVYLGPSVGYGMPYAAQYSNPQVYTKVGAPGGGWLYQNMPQAEPNGLFMPADAHGTWVLLKDPESKDVKPVYIEPDVMVVPFRLKDKECK